MSGALACGDDENPVSRPHLHDDLTPLVGKWTAGEFLGVGCNLGKSELGFKSANAIDYAIPLSYELCLKLVDDQESAQLQGKEDLFTTKIYVDSQEKGMTGFQSILDPSRLIQ